MFFTGKLRVGDRVRFAGAYDLEPENRPAGERQQGILVDDRSRYEKIRDE